VRWRSLADVGLRLFGAAVEQVRECRVNCVNAGYCRILPGACVIASASAFRVVNAVWRFLSVNALCVLIWPLDCSLLSRRILEGRKSDNRMPEQM
jgi:hypothetical protein